MNIQQFSDKQLILILAAIEASEFKSDAIVEIKSIIYNGLLEGGDKNE